MSAAERDPQFLIREGCLSKCEDIEFQGRNLPFSLLGYRITRRFAATFLGRIFSHPDAVFTDEILRPETQDIEVFAEGIDNVVATQKRVAQQYFDDGSIAFACPPLRAVLHVMKDGHFKGNRLDNLEIRQLFDGETIRSSEWYQRRLRSKQSHDIALWESHVAYLRDFLAKASHADVADQLAIRSHCDTAQDHLKFVSSSEYIQQLDGSVGREEIHRFVDSTRQL